MAVQGPEFNAKLAEKLNEEVLDILSGYILQNTPKHFPNYDILLTERLNNLQKAVNELVELDGWALW